VLKKLNTWIFLTLVLSPFCATALELTLTTALGAGALEGYTQIPKGGNFGTSSFKRPTYQENNLNHDDFYQVGLQLSQDGYFCEGMYERLHPIGQTTLSQTLTTHAQTIPASRPFAMQVQFNWYTLGFGKIFNIQNTAFRLTPRLDANWLQFKYNFLAYPNQSQRAFTLLNVSAGLMIETSLNRAACLYLEGKATLPLSNLWILNIEAGYNYFIDVHRHLKLVPSLALGVLTIDYEDEQPFPNHIRYVNSPYAKIGLKFTLC
jgi:hypothetical protein